MKRRTTLFGFTLIAAVLFAMCQPVPEAATPETTEADKLKRGEYLVNAMGCDDCHTPKKMTEHGPEPDMERRFMGHPADLVLPSYEQAWVAPGQWIMTNNDLTGWVGPWGESYAANISSDDSGIGAWSEENFVRAIREGLFKGLKGGRPLLPPMPWQVYRNLNDEDLSAIFAYLQTSKPMRNVVPPAKMAEAPPQ